MVSKKNQERIDALLKEAETLFDDSQFEAAITKCDEILELDPKHYEALILGGVSKDNCGQHIKAIEDFDRSHRNKQK